MTKEELKLLWQLLQLLEYYHNPDYGESRDIDGTILYVKELVDKS